jgi:hypothetical protein
MPFQSDWSRPLPQRIFTGLADVKPRTGQGLPSDLSRPRSSRRAPPGPLARLIGLGVEHTITHVLRDEPAEALAHHL